jgi:hypothetical protein
MMRRLPTSGWRIEHTFDTLACLMESGTALLTSVDELNPLLQPGRITEVTGFTGMGMTRLGLGLLVAPSRRSSVVALDVKGWLSPLAAWEMGVDPTRFVVVRCPDTRQWPQVAAALIEGMRAVYAEVPAGVPPQSLRRLAALARARRCGVALRPLGGELPTGVAHLRLRATEVRWEGADRGHGQLRRRYLVMEATGKGVAGIPRRIEMVDYGRDVMRVVPRLGTEEREAERAVG